MSKVNSNRKATKGRRIFYQDIHQEVATEQKQQLPLKLNWFIKLLVKLRLANAEDFRKYKTVVVKVEKKLIKTIKHHQPTENEIIRKAALRKRLQRIKVNTKTS